MTQSDIEPSLHELPWYKCESLFCSAYAPFVNRPILIHGVPKARLIGWCPDCSEKRGRYICTRCALRERQSEENAEWQKLICRYCGTPLGNDEDVFRLDESGYGDIDSSPSEQSSNDEMPPIPERAWWALYQHAIRSGLIETSGLQNALHVKESGNHSDALILFNKELNRCRSVGYRTGMGRCLLEIGKLFLETDRPDEGLENISMAEPLLRESRNDKLLRECLGYKMWLQKTTNAAPAERLPVLNEVIKLYDEAHARGMRQYTQAIELFVKERIGIYFESNKVVEAMVDLRRFPDGIILMRQMAQQMHDNNQRNNRLPKHAADVMWDEELLDSMRGSQDVWGCPRGCRLQATYGIVGLPRGSAGGRMPCLVCGNQYILLNNYYSFTAGVPDFMASNLLEPDQLKSVPADTIEVINNSFALREAGDLVAADQLQQLVIAEWEALLGCDSSEFALSLSIVGGTLLFRNEHTRAIALFERVIGICQKIPESQSELLASCFNNIGISLASLRDIQKAEEALKEACVLNPTLPNPYYWLAKIYANENASEYAEREANAWQSYVDRHPISLPRKEEALLRLIKFAWSRGESERLTDLQLQLAELRRDLDMNDYIN